MDAFLASLQVTLVTTRSYANFVERMIRTLKEKLRVRQLTFDEPWDQLLPAVVKQYNEQVHASTRMAPKLAALDENNDAVRAQLLKRAKPSRRPGLVVGDIVKIARPHTAGRRNQGRAVRRAGLPRPGDQLRGRREALPRQRAAVLPARSAEDHRTSGPRAVSRESRTEDEQPLVPRISRAMQQQYSRNVNRRLRLERLYGDPPTTLRRRRRRLTTTTLRWSRLQPRLRRLRRLRRLTMTTLRWSRQKLRLRRKLRRKPRRKLRQKLRQKLRLHRLAMTLR
jgi:hypothetical protein